MARDYMVGRGEVHFAAFEPGTFTHRGYRYIGNTPELTLTFEPSRLDHFSSERGFRERDASVVLESVRSLSIVTDEIKPANLALFLMGSTSLVSDAGGSVAAEAINNVLQGNMYQLGESVANIIGNMMITYPGTGPTAFTVTDDAGTPNTFDAIDDYLFDPTTGQLSIVEGGGIANGTNLRVSYNVIAASRQETVSEDRQVEGMLKFIEYNPVGANKVWTFPYIAISPNGDLNLKSEEWQTIPLSAEVLRRDSFKAVYVNGAPFVPA